MENASKALIMAAGVLIGIMVLSLGVYLFATFGSSAAEINQKNEESQTRNFNAQYTSYLGREDLTIYDIVTVINKASENNNYYELKTTDRNEKTRYITVKVGNDNWETLSKTALEQKIAANGTNTKYKCIDVKISKYTQRVYEIDFKQI